MKKRYNFWCPSDETCEIQYIQVLVDEDLIDCFGIHCPFCQESMVRGVSEE